MDREIIKISKNNKCSSCVNCIAEQGRPPLLCCVIFYNGISVTKVVL